MSSKTLSITLLVELTLRRTTLLISTTLDVISLTWSLQIMLVVIPVHFCLVFFLCIHSSFQLKSCLDENGPWDRVCSLIFFSPILTGCVCALDISSVSTRVNQTKYWLSCLLIEVC